MKDAIGINRSCGFCGSSFYCTDGDWFCSSECYDKYEAIHEDDDEQ